ncbi:MAG: PilZ domain-containing protein [Desulfovibrionaceae bacterium]|nr:PilZ domain-containing protein [Desulfovibrionaceae bacterium]
MADFDLVGTVSLEQPDGAQGSGARRSYRTTLPGLTAVVTGHPKAFPVNDISSGGMCVTMPASRLSKGQVLPFDLFIAGRLFLKDVRAKVVRPSATECAFVFEPLALQQETKLDKLILELQKREIIRQRQARDAEKAAANAQHAAQGASAQQSGGDGQPLPTIHLSL